MTPKDCTLNGIVSGEKFVKICPIVVLEFDVKVGVAFLFVFSIL